jgi:hypothetical protein
MNMLTTIPISKSVEEYINNPWADGALLIAAYQPNWDDNAELLKIPYEEIQEIFDGEEERLWTIRCNSTEGVKEWAGIVDFVFIGDFTQWCIDNQKTIQWI